MLVVKPIAGSRYVQSSCPWTSVRRCCFLILLLFSAGTAAAKTSSVFDPYTTNPILSKQLD